MIVRYINVHLIIIIITISNHNVGFNCQGVAGHILRKIFDCTGGAHGERAAQAHNRGLGAEPPAGSRGRAPGGGSGGEAP